MARTTARPAAGSPASRALADHVENCDVCSEALREWKARMSRIDAGIGQLADSEPSREAIPRVMAEARLAARTNVSLAATGEA